MATVIWSDRAIIHLAGIAAYIRDFDPVAADRMAVRLLRAGDSLSSFPRRGRPIADGIRELPSVPPYVIRYLVEEDRVTILSLRHGARRPDGGGAA